MAAEINGTLVGALDQLIEDQRQLAAEANENVDRLKDFRREVSGEKKRGPKPTGTGTPKQKAASRRAKKAWKTRRAKAAA